MSEEGGKVDFVGVVPVQAPMKFQEAVDKVEEIVLGLREAWETLDGPRVLTELGEWRHRVHGPNEPVATRIKLDDQCGVFVRIEPNNMEGTEWYVTLKFYYDDEP